ncbi:unnamed protein product [Pylaiella littoralis]
MSTAEAGPAAASVPAALTKAGACERTVLVGRDKHVVKHTWRYVPGRGVLVVADLVDNKHKNRATQHASGCVSENITEATVSKKAAELADKVLKNKRERWQKTQQQAGGGSSGVRRKADSAVADPVIAALRGDGRTRSGLEMSQPAEPEEPPSVEIDWNTLRKATCELKVPVSLFVLCKTISEGEAGAHFLNATVVQRVQVGNVPILRTPRGPTPTKSIAEQLEGLMFDICLKGPFSGGEVKKRRGVALTRLAASPDSTWLFAQTSDLVSVPINLRSTWHWFPFRILQGAVDLELQAKSISFEQREKVFLCPTLYVSDPGKFEENVVKARPMDDFDRSRTFVFLRKKPKIEIVEDTRWKKGAKERHRDGDEIKKEHLFITYPLMRLTFWLHEPTSKAVFKVLGPLLLVVTLMWVNFHEFYGIFDIWDGCPEQDVYSDYLANGIGIAIAAVVMIPLIREETRNSYHGSFTTDDCVALAFLAGLGVSTLRNCFAAFTGCVISSTVVFGAMGSLLAHEFECNKIKSNKALLEVLKDSREPKDKVKASAGEFKGAEWVDAANYKEVRSEPSRVASASSWTWYRRTIPNQESIS